MDDVVVQKLLAASRDRRTTEFFSLMTQNGQEIRSALSAPLLSQLILITSMAVEFGYPGCNAEPYESHSNAESSLGLLELLLRKFSRKHRPKQSQPKAPQRVDPYVLACLDIGQGVRAARRGHHHAALRYFQGATMHPHWVPNELLAFTKLCESNAWRKLTRYDQALKSITDGRLYAHRGKRYAAEADLKVAEGWLRLQNSERTAGLQLFREAEPILSDAGDDRRIGDMKSAEARDAQRVGQLDDAARLCWSAIRSYERCGVAHKGKARTFINLAKIMWLQGRELNADIKKCSERLRTNGFAISNALAIPMTDILAALKPFGERDGSCISIPELKSKLERLSEKVLRQYRRASDAEKELQIRRNKMFDGAIGQLDNAEKLYHSGHPWADHEGLARAAYIRAYIQAEKGNLQDAQELIEDVVYEFGRRHRNELFQARAKVVLGMLHLRRIWDGTVAQDRLLSEAAAALQEAKEAVAIADKLQNRRIRVQAYTCEGFAQLAQSPSNVSAAREALAKAEVDLILPMPRDYMTQYVRLLRSQCHHIATDQGEDMRALMTLVDKEKPWSVLEQEFHALVLRRMLKKYDNNKSHVAEIMKHSRTTVRATVRELNRASNNSNGA
jgi:hypothetical protein